MVDLDGLVAALSTPGGNTAGGATAKARVPHASAEFKGFHPGMTVDDDTGARVVTTPDVLEVLHDEKEWRALCEKLGFTVPDGWVVRLSEMRHDPAAWHRDKPGEDAVTRPVWRYRFKIEPAPDPATKVDAVELLGALRARRTPPRRTWGGDGVFALEWNDWQAGKAEGGGTPGLAERLDDTFHAAADRARWLRKGGYDLGRLLIVGNGDMVEGCTIFPNQAFHVDMPRRDQINVTTGLILHGLDMLAPLFGQVDVMVVKGNHGEHRIGGRATAMSDNDDVAVFEHAARAADRDRRLGHVAFHIEANDSAIALDVGRWRVAATHGDVYGRGRGPVEKKAWDWYSRKAAQRHPVGQADVLVTAHFHHLAKKDFGSTLWVQGPAMDGGSAWFEDWSGQSAEPAMLSWVMTPDSRYEEEALLTPNRGSRVEGGG